jgi:hypothetical protein
MTVASAALTTGPATVVRSSKPNGMPNMVERTSRPALPRWTSRQSRTRTSPATVTETRTANGAATSTGMISASRGTATSASPNPNADRIRVARKSTASTGSIVWSAVMTPPSSL